MVLVEGKLIEENNVPSEKSSHGISLQELILCWLGYMINFYQHFLFLLVQKKVMMIIYTYMLYSHS